MKIARGGWQHILVGLVCLVIGGLVLRLVSVPVGLVLSAAGALLTAFMVYFFRDPERTPPDKSGVVVSGADGWVRSVELVPGEPHLKTDTVRVSTYLTPWDVHVNRVPLAGRVVGLDYSPGRHLLTRNPASSDVNEHSTILIEGKEFTYMVRQIVGPVVRRVVYWLEEDQQVAIGERLGIMKFGSRLDVYLPADRVDTLVRAGDRVFAGVTPIAQRKEIKS